MKPRYQFDIKRMNADCETNYLRLCRLMPALPALADDARVQADARSGRFDWRAVERDLRIEFEFQHRPVRIEISVTEQCRFTTTLSLSLSLSRSARVEPSQLADTSTPVETALFGNSLAAQLVIRMYHDVRMVEVIAIDGLQARWASYDPDASPAGNGQDERLHAMFQPDEKAQQNRFLGELLSLGLHHGMMSESSEQFDMLNLLMRAPLAASHDSTAMR